MRRYAIRTGGIANGGWCGCDYLGDTILRVPKARKGGSIIALHRLWNLWNMFKIDAYEFHKVIAILHNVIGLAQNNQANSHSVISEGGRSSTIDQLTRLKAHSDTLQCQVTSLGIEEVQRVLKIDEYITYFSCGQMLVRISNNLQNELSLKKVYVIDPKKADYYYATAKTMQLQNLFLGMLSLTNFQASVRHRSGRKVLRMRIRYGQRIPFNTLFGGCDSGDGKMS